MATSRRFFKKLVHLALVWALLLGTLAGLFAAPQVVLAAIVTEWNFNSPTPDANTATGTTDPAIGSGTATLVGGTTATFASGDASGGSSDPATGDDSGWNVTTFAAQGTGDRSRGVEFRVSTVGLQNIRIDWDQRHSNTAARHVQFQYTADGTTWIDFGAPFEGTAGDTWFNNRAVDLSGIAAVNDNASFGFRIVATFAPGTSTYVASNPTSSYASTGTWRFDMVTLDAEALGAPIDNPPTVISTTPTNGATNVAANANLGVTFSENVTVSPTSFTINCTTSGSVAFSLSGSGASYTLDPSNDFAASESCTLTVVAAQVTDQDGTPDPMAADFTATFSIAAPGPTITKISAIQGSGSAVTGPGPFTVEAIVVGDYQGQAGTELQGFFLQEEDADADNDLATSEGIFVFCSTCPVNVAVGDLVQVNGGATEFFNMSQIVATGAASVTVLSSNNPLPSPATPTLPVPGVTGTDLATARQQINAYFEQFEGMLVRFEETLSIAEYFELARYGQLVLAQGGRPRQFTDTNLPSTSGFAQSQVDFARRTIILDDLNNTQNFAIGTATSPRNAPYFWPRPGLSTSNFFRGGDTIGNLTGVLHWSFAGQSGTDAWRIRPVEPSFSYAFTRTNTRPAAPVVAGNLKVVAYNVLNYFPTVDTTSSNDVGTCGPSLTLDCRGADSAAELARQQEKLTAALLGLNADIVGLIEIENTPGVTPTLDIVDDLNAELGAGSYAFIDTGVIGSDAIRVGIIYKPGRVQPVGDYAILDSSVDPNFDSSRNRPALAQTFEQVGSGARFTVVVNHLKSKGDSGLGGSTGICTTQGPGADVNCDQGDGQGFWNDSRTRAAEALATWLASDPTNSGDDDFMIIGDLNAYRNEDPVTALENAGYIDLLDSLLGPGAYSFLFSGQLGYLDHALASPSLAAQVAGVAEWHINADEVPLLDYNDDVRDPGEAVFERESNALPLYAADAFRTSDHDPLIVGLNLARPNTPPALTALETYDTGLGANGAEIVSLRGNRAILTNAGDGSLDILDTTDILSITRITRITGLTGLTSAAIHPSKDLFVVTAGQSAPPRSGTLYVFRLSDATLLAQATIGADAASPNGRQPDAVEIAPDGSVAVIAIEAEQVSASDDGGPGAIGLLDLSSFDPASPTSITVQVVELPDISGVPGVTSGRTYDLSGNPPVTNQPGTVEPEGLAFAPDSQTVFVSLQENNAVARLSLTGALPATLPVSQIFGLGQVNFLTDRTNDGAYIPNQQLTTFREPDGLRAVEIDGTLYVVTADEGDTRPNPRGGRTVSIFNATTGALVSDLGNQLADLADRFGLYVPIDNRSTSGGVEPEMLDVASFAGRVIAAVSLERANAIALVDISDPTAPVAFQLIRSGAAPEGIKLVERDGALYALSANEASGTLTVGRVPLGEQIFTQIYRLNKPLELHDLAVIDPDAADTLTVTLELPASAGTLSGIADLGGGLYSVSGTPAVVNTALAGLLFTPTAGFFGSVDVSVTATDGASPAATGLFTLKPLLIPPTIKTAPQPGFCPVGNSTTGIIYYLRVGDDFSDPGALQVRVSGVGGPVTSARIEPVDGQPDLRKLVVDVAALRSQVRRATLTVEVTDGTNQTTSLPIQVIVGTSGDDALAGTDGADIIVALGGNDVVYAGAGDDLVCGGTGNDQLYGEDGNDSLYASDGADLVDGGDGDDCIDGGKGNDRLLGGAGADLIFGGDGADLIEGGDGDDTLYGEDGNDTLNGGEGDDILFGGNGADTLNGDDGNDTLSGGPGNDTLNGGDGDDTMTGGPGRDRFDGGAGTDVALDANFGPPDRDTVVNVP
jgi:hypothetical protein